MRERDEVRLLTPRTSPGLREVWGFRHLLGRLVSRDLTVKYQRSALGFLWTLLNPLVTLLVLVGLFTYVVRIEVENYWAFLISGYFVWNFVSLALSSSSYILREHSSLCQSVAFPTQLLILSASLSKLIEYLMEMAMVLLVLALFHHRHVPLSWILLPLLVLLQYLMTIGLMYPVATFSALFQDIQHALPLLLITWFYASPVFYPVEAVPEAIQPFYFLNPLAGLLKIFRVVLYEGRFPSATGLAAVAMCSLVVWAAGYAIFKRYQGICVETV